MALDFPESPNPGDLFPAASPRWEWDGAKWSALSTGVIAFNGRTGGVTLVGEDVSLAGGALTASPVFTGIPTAPTALHGVNDQQIATTAFVMSAISASTSGVSSWEGRTGAVQLTANDISARGGALVSSPSFTGVPQSITPSAGSIATMIATKAYVDAGVGASVTSFNARTGAVTLQLSDVTGVGGAPLNNPALAGIPTAPTASPGTANQQLATTGFVAAALTGPGVTSLNGKAGALSVSINQRMFTSNATYVPTAGTVLAMVEAVGGSGGGGATSYGANWGMFGGGGGSGGYSRSILTAAQIGASQLITIGQGGAGAVGTQWPAATGGNGTATSFGSLVVAAGGQGGQSMDATNMWGQPGAGATAGSGQLALAGNPGFVGGGGMRNGPTGTTWALCNGGNGGAMFSGAGLGTFVQAGTGFVNGVSGTLGGGGGGGTMFMTGSPASGGNGGGGWCLVTELVLG